MLLMLHFDGVSSLLSPAIALDPSRMKMSILLINNQPPFSGRREHLGIKITKIPKTRMVRMPYDYVV